MRINKSPWLLTEELPMLSKLKDCLLEVVGSGRYRDGFIFATKTILGLSPRLRAC